MIISGIDTDEFFFYLNKTFAIAIQNLILNPKEGVCDHPPQSENRNLLATEHLVDPKPICKLKFVYCAPVEKNRAYLSRFSHGGLTKFKNTFFPNRGI